MAKFTYDDIVRVLPTTTLEIYRGAKAWVVGVHDGERRKGSFFAQFPQGTVYTIEFEDGSSTQLHESDLCADGDAESLS